MKNIIQKLMFLVPVLAITGCSIYTTVYSDYDRSVDFKQYKTFAILPDSGVVIVKDSFTNTPYDNDIIRNNTKNYIIHCLSERGYRVATDSPDLVVQLVLLNEKKERVTTYQPYYGYPYSYSPYYSPYYYQNRYYYPYYYPYYEYYTYYGWGYSSYYYGGYSTTYKETYVKGTIIINLFDTRKKKLIWTGVAEGDIYDPEYIQYEVHPAVHSIMNEYPIKPIGKEK